MSAVPNRRYGMGWVDVVRYLYELQSTTGRRYSIRTSLVGSPDEDWKLHFLLAEDSQLATGIRRGTIAQAGYWPNVNARTVPSTLWSLCFDLDRRLEEERVKRERESPF